MAKQNNLISNKKVRVFGVSAEGIGGVSNQEAKAWASCLEGEPIETGSLLWKSRALAFQTGAGRFITSGAASGILDETYNTLPNGLGDDHLQTLTRLVCWDSDDNTETTVKLGVQPYYVSKGGRLCGLGLCGKKVESLGVFVGNRKDRQYEMTVLTRDVEKYLPRFISLVDKAMKQTHSTNKLRCPYPGQRTGNPCNFGVNTPVYSEPLGLTDIRKMYLGSSTASVGAPLNKL